MTNNIFDHKLSKRFNFNLQNNSRIQLLLTNIDNMTGQLSVNNKLSGQFLQRLNQTIVASSTGASTRIEGSKLGDQEIERLIKDGKLRKITTRDEQEVVGYFEVLEDVFENYLKVRFSERSVKQIHSILLKYCQKDTRHRGAYKLQSNQVVAIDNQNQILGIIFDPATVEETPGMMTELINWTNQALETKSIHPILVIANFVFEFLSIHPFKDGNGRVSRVLTNLLLLQNGYKFTKYVSHEKLIEEHKTGYYLALRKASKTWNSDCEDVSDWILFILEIFQKQAIEATKLLNSENGEMYLSSSQDIIWKLFLTNESLSRKEIFNVTNIPLATIEYAIRKLLKMNKIIAIGEGRGRRYKVLD